MTASVAELLPMKRHFRADFACSAEHQCFIDVSWEGTRVWLLFRVEAGLELFYDSFYPGISSGGSFPAIGGGIAPSGVLNAPSGFTAASGASGSQAEPRASGERVTAPRPMRVLGSLDHPILPMPPVCTTPRNIICFYRLQKEYWPIGYPTLWREKRYSLQ